MTGRLQQILYALKLALPHTLTLEGTKEEMEKASMAGMLFKVIMDRGWRWLLTCSGIKKDIPDDYLDTSLAL